MYEIAIFPGDGIGKEVIAEGVKVLEAVEEAEGPSFDLIFYPNGADHYLKTGELISDDTLEEVGRADSIYFGAIGDQRVEPGVLERGLLLRLRTHFDQFVNLRPISIYPGLSPILGARGGGIKFYVVRENTEGFYVGLGSRITSMGKREHELVRGAYRAEVKVDLRVSGKEEIAYQIGIFSRSGTERIVEYAFSLAVSKGLKRVTCVDKANVLTEGHGLWREVFDEVARRYPSVEGDHQFVDAAAMSFILEPERYGVVVTTNMFGDILTDLGGAIQGSLGMAASGNINPQGLSMFEPVHGSAPSIVGRGEANPIGAITAAQLMLETLGERRAAGRLEEAISALVGEGNLTPDLGGRSKTAEIGDRVCELIRG